MTHRLSPGGQPIRERVYGTAHLVFRGQLVRVFRRKCSNYSLIQPVNVLRTARLNTLKTRLTEYTVCNTNDYAMPKNW